MCHPIPDRADGGVFRMSGEKERWCASLKGRGEAGAFVPCSGWLPCTAAPLFNFLPLQGRPARCKIWAGRPTSILKHPTFEPCTYPDILDGRQNLSSTTGATSFKVRPPLKSCKPERPGWRQTACFALGLLLFFVQLGLSDDPTPNATLVRAKG